ncbi:MAG TPA: ImmA/IrrE family metallo-endopeptidase [Mobilitalea sp.]|nr:ImmA/IrrE family metallo-endopeptidase [Mobilitalea sp.]
MPSVTVNIAPEVINWVMDRTKVDEISASIYEKMLNWKNGEKIPTFNQIEDVSKATNIPLGYFFLQKPPIEDVTILQFRTIDSYYTSNPSRNLIDTINSMESIQEWMRDYLIKSDYAELDFIGSMKNNRDSKNIADNIRKTLRLEKTWYSTCSDAAESFRLLRNKMETSGIIVMMSGIVEQNTHRTLDIEEFRAFTLLDNYAPLIFVNSNDSKSGKLFSLLHEVSHIWIGANSFYNDRYNKVTNLSQDEVMCNAVAAELLVPNDIFIALWNNISNYEEVYDKIKKLASIFRCGTTVIARRALDNEFVESEVYYIVAEEAIKNYLENKEKKSSGGGDYYITAASRYDHRFLIALDNSVRECKTQFTDAYRLTKTNRKTFSKLLDKVRGIDG